MEGEGDGVWEGREGRQGGGRGQESQSRPTNLRGFRATHHTVRSSVNISIPYST